MSRRLKLYVALTDVREDTVAPRYRQLGYVVINDTITSNDDEAEPVLTEKAMFKRPFANLTLGFFSGQAKGPDHVSRVKYDTEFRTSGQTWNQVIMNWCQHEGVSDERRPSTPQLVGMLRELRIPLEHGSELVRDILERVIGVILKIKSASAVKPATKQVGKTTMIQNVIAHLVNTGKFDKAIKSLPKAAVSIEKPRQHATPAGHHGLLSPPMLTTTRLPRQRSQHSGQATSTPTNAAARSRSLASVSSTSSPFSPSISPTASPLSNRASPLSPTPLCRTDNIYCILRDNADLIQKISSRHDKRLLQHDENLRQHDENFMKVLTVLAKGLGMSAAPSYAAAAAAAAQV